jgi:hypothetical protein
LEEQDKCSIFDFYSKTKRKDMKHVVLLFVGLVLVGTAVLLYYKLGSEATTIKINGKITHSAATKDIVRYSVGGFLALLGVIFILAGLIGRSRAAKQKQLNLQIMQTGIDAEGTVTFVDKNYSVLVNKVPVYSIVEYTYQDRTGKQHTRRVSTLNSELVIRNRVQVGSRIPIKYSAEDSATSILLLQPA